MHSIGLGPVKSNQAKALLYYTFAALSDDDDYKHQSHLAKMALGYRYLLGIGVPPNCEFSLSYYRVVAKKVEENITFAGSNSILRIRLLDELENPGSYGSVLDDDLIHYYQFLAEKGDIQAQVGLGQLHFQGGRGVNMNQYRAYQYFKMAAESGNTNAMAFLGKVSSICIKILAYQNFFRCILKAYLSNKIMILHSNISKWLPIKEILSDKVVWA